MEQKKLRGPHFEEKRARRAQKVENCLFGSQCEVKSALNHVKIMISSTMEEISIFDTLAQI
jgi:hypothetical protein